MAKIGVIDDEGLMRDLVSTSLSRLHHEVTSFNSGDDFIRAFNPREFDLIVTDMKMPGLSGLELSEKVLAKDPQVPIILMTAYGTVDNAVQAMKMGVQDFIEKPFQVEKLEHIISRVLEVKGLKTENIKLKENLRERYKFIGQSDAIKDMLDLVENVAASKSTVLITGESGTGKELIAHAIHFQSQRHDAPLVKLNCAAIPDNLLESELFGHEKGAYTGAIKTRVGKFEQANGGAILLDEIGEMPLHAQSKLLRVLQERELTKVGGNSSLPLDVRVICTTNRDLQKEVEEEKFREDLFYRLNVIPIKVPPLRERKGDIPLLCEHFVAKYNRENGFSVDGITEACMEKLQSHNWPGNVRELENVIQRAVIFAKFETIDVKHLKMFDVGPAKEAPAKNGEFKLGMTIAEGEKNLILKTLESCGDNRTRAAELLGISVRTLRNKLHEYRINESHS